MSKKKRKPDTTLPTTHELLAELTTLDELEVWMPGALDHHRQQVPQGAEVVLVAQRFSSRDKHAKLNSPLNVQMPMTRHDAEYVIESLYTALHPNSGGSIAHMLWGELGDVVDRIQRRVVKGKDPLKADVGEALGIARSIAIMINPFAFDIDEVRNEAMVRWEERQA